MDSAHNFSRQQDHPVGATASSPHTVPYPGGSSAQTPLPQAFSRPKRDFPVMFFAVTMVIMLCATIVSVYTARAIVDEAAREREAALTQLRADHVVLPPTWEVEDRTFYRDSTGDDLVMHERVSTSGMRLSDGVFDALVRPDRDASVNWIYAVAPEGTTPHKAAYAWYFPAEGANNPSPDVTTLVFSAVTRVPDDEHGLLVVTQAVASGGATIKPELLPLEFNFPGFEFSYLTTDGVPETLEA